MEFYKQNVEGFLQNFEHTKSKIKAFKGCLLLELYRDKSNPTVFFTYSYWDSEEALEDYRKSELFHMVWSKIKPLFSTRPEAWSVDKLETLE
jgi:quinol monooxygenase YgiN